MKRAISLSIASVVPIFAVFGGCSSSGSDPASSGSSSSGSQTGQATTLDGSLSDAANTEASVEEASVTTTSDTTAYSATLNGYNVLPSPVRGTAAQGTGQFTLLSDGVTLQYTISASGLSSPVTSVNFHVGSAVDTGGISHQIVLGADASVSGGSVSLSGSITLSATTPDEVDALPAGRLYVDVSTMNNPGGEIRGQITLPGATVMVANLTGAQQVPPVMSAYTAAAAFVVSPDGTTVQYHVTPGANLTETVISGISNGTAIGGEPIDEGAVMGLQTSANGPISTDGTIAITSPTPWFNGEEFLNITTQAHPSGELRGQVIFPAETLFTSTLGLTPVAAMNGSLTRGGAQVILNPMQTGIRYEVDTTSANLTGVFLKIGGFPGTPTTAADGGGMMMGGGMVTNSYQLTIVGSEATNQSSTLDLDASVPSLPIMSADVMQLQAGNAWILVDTNSYMNGELQGALTQQ